MEDLDRKIKNLKNAYAKDWRKKNPNSSKQAQYNYWKRKVENLERRK